MYRIRCTLVNCLMKEPTLPCIPSPSRCQFQLDVHITGAPSLPSPLSPDPPLDPSGPSAGRVVVSGDRRFKKPSLLQLTKDVVPCLLEDTRVEEARAAATTNGGTTPKYLVTVYARRAGEDGPPVPFQAVPLTPSPAGHGTMSWYLSGLGPLHQHLGLAPRSPVRLVREVGQDGRVRVVVEPRGEGEGGGGKQGEGVTEREGAVEREGEEGGQGGKGAGVSSGSDEDDEGSEPGSSDEVGSLDEGGGSDSGSIELDDPPWRPRGGAGQRARGAKRMQPQQQPQPQQQQQQPGAPGGGGGDGAGPSGAGAGGAGVVGKGPGGGEEGRPGKRRRLEERPAQQNGGCKVILNHSDHALPVRTPVSTQAVGLQVSFLNASRSKDTYVHFFTSCGGHQYRRASALPSLQTYTVIPGAYTLATGLPPSGGGAHPAAQPAAMDGDSAGEEAEPLCLNADTLAAHMDSIRAALEAAQAKAAALQADKAALWAEKAALEGSRVALAAAEARAAALAADKANLEGQLGRERGRAEAAEREREAAQQQLSRESANAVQQLKRETERAEAAEGQLGRERAAKEAAQQQVVKEKERAEAAEAQLRRARQHMAGVMQRFGLPVKGAPGQQSQPAPPMSPPMPPPQTPPTQQQK